MSTNGTPAQTATATTTAASTVTQDDLAAVTPATLAPASPEQLTLLATPSVPLQFRLDERTRRAGLAHVAALRAQIAAQAASRNLSPGAKRMPNRAARQIAA